jgi:predicted nucleotidyltransferase
MTAVDPTKIAAHLRELGDKHGYEFDTILVFGSYATGDATEASDVDIVAVSSDFSNIEYALVNHIVDRCWVSDCW